MTRRIAMLFATGITFALTQIPTTPARAANSGVVQTFVSSTGNDANTATLCVRASPCKSFNSALSVTQTSGVVTCLDPVIDFNAVTISDSVTIDCEQTYATVYQFGMITIATPGIKVTLRGLTLFSTSLAPSGTGINITAGADVEVEKCKISGIRTNGARGINVAPSGGTAKVRIIDSFITDNGLAASQGGIVVEPTGSGNAHVVVEHSRVAGNTHGIVASGLLTSGSVVIQVRDSVTTQNALNGIFAITGAPGNGPVGILVDQTSSIDNAGTGILAQGGAALVHLGRSTVAGNATGLNALSGGQILSYQNNQASGNFADGAPTGVLALK